MARVDGAVLCSDGATAACKTAAVAEVYLTEAADAPVGLGDEWDDLIVLVDTSVVIVAHRLGDVSVSRGMIERAIVGMPMALSTENLGVEPFLGVAEGDVVADVGGSASALAVAAAGVVFDSVRGEDLDFADGGSAPAASTHHDKVGNIAVRIGGGDDRLFFVAEEYRTGGYSSGSVVPGVCGALMANVFLGRVLDGVAGEVGRHTGTGTSA